jgi:hypothetical protein
MGRFSEAKHARVFEQPTSGKVTGKNPFQSQDVQVLKLVAVFLIRSPIEKPSQEGLVEVFNHPVSLVD